LLGATTNGVGCSSSRKEDEKPVSLTGEKLSAIAKLYDEKCASCHGDQGASNGPAAKALSKEPANFTDSKAMERTKDGALLEDRQGSCANAGV